MQSRSRAARGFTARLHAALLGFTLLGLLFPRTASAQNQAAGSTVLRSTVTDPETGPTVSEPAVTPSTVPEPTAPGPAASGSTDEDALAPPMSRLASGTSWQPDTTAMRGVHLYKAGWMVMLHGAGSFGFDWQNGPRGGRAWLSTNWVMGMAQHELWSGTFTLRGMFSLEPATVPAAGYPQLLQTGEFYNGVHLHDHQHPHNFFMELAADYRHPLSDWLGVEVYGGPVAEPALGPVAFMHRASAADDPFPPLGHHWQDSTHVTFGVATVGLYTKDLKLEGSWFNGREPDQNRWDIELRPFDSYSIRLSAVPEEHVALQVSYGYLASPEPPQYQGVVLGVSRATASIQLSLPHLEATLIWGRNLEITPLDSFLLEARYDPDGSNVPFFRLERVDKSAHDLAVPDTPSYQAYTVHEAVLGFAHHFPTLGPLEPALGVRGSLAIVPAELSGLYGGRVQPGVYVYLLVQAARMRMTGMMPETP